MKQEHARDLHEALLRTVNGHDDKVQYLICSVDSVDLEAQTCSCTPISSKAATQLINVLLTAESNDGWLLVPTVNSTVMVIKSNYNPPFVAMYSDIDKAYLITANGFQVGAGTSPMVLGDKNAQALKDLAGKIDAIFQAISGAGVTPGDGGATFKAAIIAALSGNGFPISATFGTEADGTKSQKNTLD